MGELRYEVTHEGDFRVFEANETSGYYLALKSHTESLNFYVENSIDNIPGSIRASDFHGIKYHPSRLHLPEELKGIVNVRHDLNGSIQLLLFAYHLILRRFDLTQVERIIDRFKTDRTRDLSSILWLKNHLVEMGELRAEEFRELENALFLLRAGRWRELIVAANAGIVIDQIEELARKNNSPSRAPVNVIALDRF